MQPRTRGPEAVETKTQDHDSVSDTATPRLSVTVKTAAAPPSALDLCGCIQRALLTTRRRHRTVCKSRNSFADALFTRGLMALMPPTI